VRGTRTSGDEWFPRGWGADGRQCRGGRRWAGPGGGRGPGEGGFRFPRRVPADLVLLRVVQGPRRRGGLAQVVGLGQGFPGPRGIRARGYVGRVAAAADWWRESGAGTGNPGRAPMGRAVRGRVRCVRRNADPRVVRAGRGGEGKKRFPPGARVSNAARNFKRRRRSWLGRRFISWAFGLCAWLFSSSLVGEGG